MNSHHHKLAIRLNGKNYFLWASYFKNFFEGQELWKYIDQTTAQPTVVPANSTLPAPKPTDPKLTYPKWVINNDKIKT